jgi:N-acyl-L-homoserine lactone synthetase
LEHSQTLSSATNLKDKESENNLSANNAASKNDELYPDQNHSYERDGLLPEQDDLLTEQDDLLPEQDDLLPEQDDLLPEQDDLLTEQDDLLTEQDDLLTEQDDLLTEQDDLLTEQDDLPTASNCNKNSSGRIHSVARKSRATTYETNLGNGTNHLHLITPKNYNEYPCALNAIYQFRHFVFCEQLRWVSKSLDKLEKDQFDEKEGTSYLIYVDPNGILRGCIRLIEMFYDCMFDGPFYGFLEDREKYKKEGFWEISRLAIDRTTTDKYDKTERRKVLPTLLGAVNHLSFHKGIKESFLIVFPKQVKTWKKFEWAVGKPIKATRIKDLASGKNKKVLTISYITSTDFYNLFKAQSSRDDLPSLDIHCGKEIIKLYT